MSTNITFDIFHGRLTHPVAHVYARVADLPGGGEWRLSGRVRGPECRHGKTLPATFEFEDLGPGQTLLARATIPEPSFWSPDLPATYSVRVEVHQAGKLVSSHEQLLGLRFLGVQGRSFFWAGKRWVLRAVRYDERWNTPLSEWRDRAAAMWVAGPDDSLCEEASREGVLMLVDVAGELRSVTSELQRLSRWPAVAIVATASSDHLSELQRAFPNLLFAEKLRDAELQFDKSKLLLVPFEQLGTHSERIGRVHSSSIIVSRSAAASATLSEARDACDGLQRDCALISDFAGYVIEA